MSVMIVVVVVLVGEVGTADRVVEEFGGCVGG